MEKILIQRDIMSEYRKSRQIPDKSQIMSSKDTVRIMGHKLTGLDHEEFWVLSLDSSLHLSNMELLFTGGISGIAADHILLAKKCIIYGFTRIIVLHDNPSGNPKPGLQDMNATRAIRDALKVIGAELLDQIIIGHDTYYSFADEAECRMMR